MERTGDGAESVTYAYDAADRLLREDSSTRGAIEYAYDADGQLVGKSGGGHDYAYAYGVEGRLQAVRDGGLLLMSAAYDGDGKLVAEETLYHASRDLAAVPGAGLLVDFLGGGPQDEVRTDRAISAAVHAMASMAGALSCAANPAVACEASPIAVRVARELFGMGGAYVPEGVPRLLLDAGGLAPASPGLAATDEAYDTTSFVNSTVFEVPQVAATASTRDGSRAYAYGNSRLSALSGAGAVEYLQDGRGSTVQEATARGGVTAWRAYTAQGEVAAGSNPSERPFFGYNSERQDPGTGLVDMHARRYDSSSGRFGVADVVLGALSDPLSLNRYLYCESDPVNFTDPTGHVKAKVKKTISMDTSAQKGKASIGLTERLFTQVEFGMNPQKSPALAKVWGSIHTSLWEIKTSTLIREQYGVGAQWLFSNRAAASYRRNVQEIYCGNADHVKAFALDLHAFAQEYGMVPVVSTLADWCAYVAEGDVGMTSLYSILALLETNPYSWISGSSKAGSAAKGISRLYAGAGINIAKSLSGRGLVVNGKYVETSADVAEMIINAERKGSALEKIDQFHQAASFVSKEQLKNGKVFVLDDARGTKSILLQTKGGLNGQDGIYEFILETDGKISHQRFKLSDEFDGKPN